MKQYLSRIAVGSAFFACCMFLSALILMSRDTLATMPDPKMAVLDDLGFRILPFVPYPKACYAFNMILCVLTIGPLLILHSRRFKIFKRLMVIAGLVSLVNSLSKVVTVIPTNARCSKIVNSNIMQKAAMVFINPLACEGLLLFGDSHFVSLMGFLWHEYSAGIFPLSTDPGRTRDLIKVFVFLWWLIAGLGYLLIISTHLQYSIHALFSILVVKQVFYSFHTFVKTPERLTTVPFLSWYETDIEDINEKTSLMFDYRSGSLRNSNRNSNRL